MLSEISKFVKEFCDRFFRDIMLIIIVSLFIMLAFAAGYITAKNQTKQLIQIEKSTN